MWELELLGIVFLVFGALSCAALGVVVKEESEKEEEEEGSPSFWPLSSAGVLALGLAGAISFIDGGVRSQSWGCTSFSRHDGLEKNTPYSTLTATKAGNKDYVLVRL